MIHVDRSDSDASHSRYTARRDLPDVIVVPARRSRSGQPDLSAADQPTASPSERPPPQVWDRCRLRRLIEPGFLVIVGAVVLVAAQLTTSRNDPDTGRAAPPTHGASVAYTVGPAKATHPRLIVPRTASAGEQVPVLAYRYRGPCGPVTLMFDDTPVVHRLTRYAGSPDPAWIEMFLTLDVPKSATPGPHEIALYGQPSGGVGESTCGNGAERRQQLATTTITLGP
jgi:hypothetical protein